MIGILYRWRISRKRR